MKIEANLVTYDKVNLNQRKYAKGSVKNLNAKVPLLNKIVERYDSPENVVGYVEIKESEDGEHIYGEGEIFNLTPEQRCVNALIKNGFTPALSFKANHVVLDKNDKSIVKSMKIIDAEIIDIRDSANPENILKIKEGE